MSGLGNDEAERYVALLKQKQEAVEKLLGLSRSAHDVFEDVKEKTVYSYLKRREAVLKKLSSNEEELKMAESAYKSAVKSGELSASTEVYDLKEGIDLMLREIMASDKDYMENAKRMAEFFRNEAIKTQQKKKLLSTYLGNEKNGYVLRHKLDIKK